MSATEQTQTEAETQTEKEVTIMAYGKNPKATERMFAQAIDQSHDFTETEINQHDKFRINYENRWEDDTFQTIDKELYETLTGETVGESTDQEDFTEEHSVGGATVSRQTTFTEDYVNSNKVASNALYKAIMEPISEELSHGLTLKSFWDGHYENEDGETKIRSGNRGIKKQRILVHQSKRQDTDDRFETEEEYPAAEIYVKLYGTKSEVSDWSDELIGPMLSNLAKEDGISKVRVTDCEETITKQGDCFSL